MVIGGSMLVGAALMAAFIALPFLWDHIKPRWWR